MRSKALDRFFIVSAFIMAPVLVAVACVFGRSDNPVTFICPIISAAALLHMAFNQIAHNARMKASDKRAQEIIAQISRPYVPRRAAPNLRVNLSDIHGGTVDRGQPPAE